MVTVISILLFLLSGTLFGDVVDDVLAEVGSAVQDESYTRAIALLEDARKRYPDDSRLPLRSGRLYKDRELYNLALAEFRSAAAMDPGNPQLLLDMAETWGFLGENQESAAVLEQLLLLDDPDTRDRAVDDLSWMYFKTYRLNDGVRLLEGALEERFDRAWAHTLGTLYAGLYEPEKSRFWYMKSIADALENGEELFASVAYYNLSLLEFSFYLFDQARRSAERSLELRPRSGGHLVLGELDFMAWRLPEALEAYRRAESIDETPLSRVDLASFYQRIGYLDEAVRYIGQIQSDPDESWMYHYGLDRVRFAMDLNLILSDAWRGKAETDRLTPRAGAGRRFAGLVKRIIWRVRGMYHGRLYRSLTSGYARELEREGNELDAAWNFAMASHGYPAVTRYLEAARTLETRLTARAEPWYDLEMGIETRDPELLLSALDRFTADERDPKERALRALAGKAGRRLPSSDRNGFAEELFRMNPGGLRQYGLSLPVSLRVTADVPRAVFRRLRGLLHRSGHEVSRRGSGGILLTVTGSEGDGLRWFLADPEGTTRTSAETGGARRRKDLAPVLAGLMNDFYTTRLSGASE